MKTKLAIVSLLTCRLSQVGAQEANLNVQPVATINPPENAMRIKHINPGLPGCLKEGAMTADMIQFLTPDNFVSTTGCLTLDFEPANGFPATNIAASSEGTIWREVSKKMKDPEILQNSIDTLNIKGNAWLRKVDLSWCSLDSEAKSLSPGSAGSGVFLVKDRDAGDLVSSGVQGLIALPTLGAGGEKPIAGVLFKPDKEFSGFACVLNNGKEDYSIQIVAYGDGDKVLFSYAIGIKKGSPSYVGFKTDSDAIQGVWVGQMYGGDGTIIDDVSFLQH
jgi:hypothetical protein